ncbi:GH92 family glycosyl hydrolase [Galbibacter mesophilus]|uniref:GH92 family glycosyl hydrolase n=1 Tax=Galbibacter mesophilus TaxID=379069 RepID=UPI00191CB4D0|nr:GH92 family glycosyl hydrolase [Galbibacter mesophilus]MCM5663898.1 GH92 family glycosyl hydrolase [Galbibacter mesophilus]
MQRRKTSIFNQVTKCKSYGIVAFAMLFAVSLTAQKKNNNKQTNEPVDFVDPFIGTEGPGHVFPGASLPFGMVKLGPDCHGHSNSGYISGGLIEGFSHTHVSGTGGGAKYGNILVKPWVGEMNFEHKGSTYADEKASAGYYTAFLKDQQVKAEVTVTEKAGFHKYTFPKSNKSHLLFDAGHFLFFGDQWGEAQELVGSEIKIHSNTEVSGYNRVRHGWNFGGAYTVYFHAEISKPAAEMGTWKNGKLYPNEKIQADTQEKTGAWFTFATDENEPILVKVGISFLSEEKAKQNLEESLSHWDFEKTVSEASNAWNEILSKIAIDGATSEEKITFYTSLYHTYLMPVDRHGENPKWQSEAPQYDDFYAIWDTYRTPHPLMTILTPNRQVEMINSLLDVYQHEGYLPDARSGNDNGRTQGGSNADVLIYDAYAKGLKGIDYELALQAMLKNATVPPGDDERKEGRGGLVDYNRLGYVSTDYERSGSRTIEYSYNDYAIAMLAKGLGKDSIYEEYIKKASNWLNLWDYEFESHGAKGFIMPKKSNGEWHKNFSLTNRAADGGETIVFDEFTTGYWEAFLYESTSWEYSLAIPHDTKRLIEATGGRKAFIDRLDTFFEKDFFLVSNEPGFLTPHLYTYAGVQHKTAERIHHILTNNYDESRDGIPGNDDSGSMGAWYVFNSMGFYPNAGQDLYLIGTPLFEKSEIELPNGKTFAVEAKRKKSSEIHIKSATLNGKPLNRAWLQHEEIANGGRLVLKMSSKPSKWASEDLPPSLPLSNKAN